MNENKIFISHSSKDIDYVKSFVENILVLGLDISAERIFCSSMNGYGVKTGEYIPDRLREEINKTSVALLFISKNYKESEICLNEVGAAWAKLSKEAVVPMLLPDVDFDELGFLNLNRIGIKGYEREGLMKFIQDCKNLLNPDMNLEKLNSKINEYLTLYNSVNEIRNSDKTDYEDASEWEKCYNQNLIPYGDVIRRSFPEREEGVFEVNEQKDQDRLLQNMSYAPFLKHLWYRYSGGDYYVERLEKLRTGNWMISNFNWEVKISRMFVCMDSAFQNEFILIRTEELEPFNIDSDVGGVSYNVGVLDDGRVISENERRNGYAKIGGETISLRDYKVEARYRDRSAHWVFIVTSYHKAGFNPDEIIEFCKKLDTGEVLVNASNILKFIRKLRNNPIVTLYN